MAKAKKKTAAKKSTAVAKKKKAPAPKAKAAKPATPKKAARAKTATRAKAAKPTKVKPPKKSPAPAKKLSKTSVESAPSKGKFLKNVSQLLSPLDDRLLVRVAEGERRTAGGLYIPDSVTASGNRRGEVVAVGRGHRDDKGRLRPLELQLGDQVLFGEYTGAKVSLLGEDFLILRESEVLGVLES